MESRENNFDGRDMNQPVGAPMRIFLAQTLGVTNAAREARYAHALLSPHEQNCRRGDPGVTSRNVIYQNVNKPVSDEIIPIAACIVVPRSLCCKGDGNLAPNVSLIGIEFYATHNEQVQKCTVTLLLTSFKRAIGK